MSLDWTQIITAGFHAGPGVIVGLVAWRAQNKKLNQIHDNTNGGTPGLAEKVADLEAENARLRGG